MHYQMANLQHFFIFSKFFWKKPAYSSRIVVGNIVGLLLNDKQRGRILAAYLFETTSFYRPLSFESS